MSTVASKSPGMTLGKYLLMEIVGPVKHASSVAEPGSAVLFVKLVDTEILAVAGVHHRQIIRDHNIVLAVLVLVNKDFYCHGRVLIADEITFQLFTCKHHWLITDLDGVPSEGGV